ncbi:MAG: two-component system response regulator, partial [Archangium sp.]|nr:two-component system response regulator [Archangium sp.]
MNAFILYVDDDAANRVVFESLVHDDVPVLTAGGGAEAIELMRRHEVAVL